MTIQEPQMQNEFLKIYAVDFDGTLTTESKFPDIGAPNTPFIKWLIREQQSGVRLILWTCRVDELLDDAVKWCRGQGIEFDAVNDNIEEIKDMYESNCRKVFATKYFDDHNSWWIDEKDVPINLEEAIAHCYQVSEKREDCETCCAEHLMLARWLEELRDRRSAEENSFMEEAQRTVRETVFRNGDPVRLKITDEREMPKIQENVIWIQET